MASDAGTLIASAASGLSFQEGTTSQVFIVTAEWTKPETSGLSSQIIQFYQGNSCATALGSSVSLSELASSASFVAPSEGVYSFKVTSLYDTGDPIVSACSTPIIVDATRPLAAWGSPSRTQINASQSVTFPLTFVDANTITLSLSNSNLTLTQTGSLSCSSMVLGGSGNSRTLTIGSCTGLGNLSVSLAAGVAVDIANNSSLALGASATVSVDAAAPSAPTLALLTPATSPGNNSRPTFRVSGLSAPDVITLHSNSSCSSASLSSGSASGATLDLQLSSALTEGSFTVYAKATDAYGNESSCSAAGSSYIYDNTRPVVAISAPTVTGMNSTGSSLYTATITEVNSYSVSLSNGDVVLNKTGSADCSSVVVAGSGATRTITLSSCTGDGTVGITIPASTVTDAAGNTSLVASSTTQITVDNTAPGVPSALTLQSPSTTPSTDSTPTIRVAGVASGNTVSIYTSATCAVAALKGTATSTGATVDITSNGLTENTFTFYADSSDSVGNKSACSSANVVYEYDNTAPVLASVTVTNSTPTNSTTYNLTYGSITGAYAEYCILENQTSVGFCSWVVGTLPASFTVSSTNNSKVLSVWIRDAAGNRSARQDSNAVVLDTVAPVLASAVITNSDPSTTRTYNLAYGAVTGTYADYCINENDTAVGNCAWVAGTLPASTLTSASANAKVLSLWLRDAATNVSARVDTNSVTYSPVIPTITIGAASSSIGNSTTNFAFTVSYSDATAVTLANGDISTSVVSGTPSCTVAVTGSGVLTRTVTLSACSGDGTIRFDIASGTASNAAGSANGAGPSATVTVDNTAPGIPSALARVSPTAAVGSDSTPTIRVNGVISGDIVSLHRDSSCTTPTLYASGTASGVTIDLEGSVGLSEGAYTLYAKSTDLAGNASACSSANVAYQYDATAATLASVTVTNSTPTNSTTYNLTYGAITGSYDDYCILENSTTVGSCSWTTGTLPSSFTVTSTNNSKVLSVWLRDTAGNVSTRQDSNAVVLDTVAPSLASAAITNSTPSTTRNYNLAYGTVTGTYAEYCINENDTVVGNCVWVTGSLPASTLTSATANAKVLSLWLRDAATNVSTRVDTNSVTYSPVIPSIYVSAANPLIGNSSTSFNITVNYVDATSVTLVAGNITQEVLTGNPSCSISVTGSGVLTRTITLSACSGNGLMRLQINSGTASNAAGLSQYSISQSFEIDNTPPSAPTSLMSISPAAAIGNDSTPTLRVSGVTIGDAVSIHRDSSCTTPTLYASGTASGGTITFDGSVPLSEGSYTFYAKATDPAGNASACSSASVAYQYDATAPALASATITNSAPSTTRTYTLSYGAVTGTYADYCILENSTTVGSCSWTSGTLPASFFVSATQNAKVLSIWLRDSALNVSARVDTNSISYNPSGNFTIADVSFSLRKGAGGQQQADKTNLSYATFKTTPTVVMNASTNGAAGTSRVQIYSDPGCTLPLGSSATGISAVGGVNIDVTEASYGRKEFYAILINGGNASACTNTQTAYFRALANDLTITDNTTPSTAIPSGGTRYIQFSAALPQNKMLVWVDDINQANTNRAFYVFNPILGTATVAGQGGAAPNGGCVEDYCLMLSLSSGKVLIISGYQATVYDPTTDAFSSAISTGSGARLGYLGIGSGQETRAVELQDGNVFVLGASSVDKTTTPIAKIINPTTFDVTQLPSAPLRIFSSLTLLPDGRVLIAGGRQPSIVGTDVNWSPESASDALYLFDPSDNSFSASAATFPEGIHSHGAVLLSGSNAGKVLFLGGSTPNAGSAADYSGKNYLYDFALDSIAVTDGTNAIDPFTEDSYYPSSPTVYQISEVETIRLPNSGNQIFVSMGFARNGSGIGEADTGLSNRTFILSADGKSYRAGPSIATANNRPPWISSVLTNGQIASIREGSLFLTTVPYSGTFSLAATNLDKPTYAHKALVTSDDKVVLLGGYTTGAATQDQAALYDLPNSSYTVLGSYGGQGPTFGFGAAWIDSSTIVVAGGDSKGTSLDLSRELSVSDSFGNAAFLVGKVQNVFSTVVNSPALGVLMIGGFDGTNVLDSISTYSSNVWSAASNTLPEGFYKHTSDVIADGSVVVIGGLKSSGQTSDRITVIRPNGSIGVDGTYPQQLMNHATAVIGSLVYIVGGETGQDKGDGSSKIYSYDASKKALTEVADLGESLVGHTVTALNDGNLLVAGGKSEKNGFSNKAYLVNVEAGTFQTLTMSGKRAYHTASKLSDGRVLLIGGIDENSNPLDTVDIYTP